MNKIKHFRLSAKLTQEQLGETMGLGQGAIGHYESGRRVPDLETCRAIVSALAAAGAVAENGSPVSLDDIFPPEADDDEAA